MATSPYTGSKWGTSGSTGTPGGQITWSFNLAGAQSYGFDAPIVVEAYRAAVRAAFDLWESIANIDFTEVATAAAQIQLGWDAIDGRGSTLAEASWRIQNGLTIDAEIAFDTAEAWSTIPGSGTSLYAVAVHEIGHAIGLSHTEDPSSIMYAYLGGQTQPSAADIAAIQSLYGAAPAGISSGTATGSTLTGTLGNDTLSGGGSYLKIAGGSGSDTITATPGSGATVTVYGGRETSDPNDGADSITVDGQGSALIFGNGGDDAILSRANGASTIYGGVGNDGIRVESHAANQLFGGPGADTIIVTGNGNNTVFGAQGIIDPVDLADTISISGNGNNTLYGNGGDDRLSVTGSGSNILYGGGGNDTLLGGSGADRLAGNTGDNVYTGGLGADRFVHTAGAHDIYTDFRFSQGDRMELGGQAYTVTAATDGSATLRFGDGGTIVLQGVAPTDINASYLA